MHKANLLTPIIPATPQGGQQPVAAMSIGLKIHISINQYKENPLRSLQPLVGVIFHFVFICLQYLLKYFTSQVISRQTSDFLPTNILFLEEFLYILYKLTRPNCQLKYC